MRDQRQLSAFDAYIEDFRSELRQAYGWTDLSANVELDPIHCRMLVSGYTALRSIASRFSRGLSADGIVVSLRTAEERAAWHALREPVTRIWRDASATTPATELLRSDGPVQLLARTRHASLVRAIDDTTGWTCDPLGDAVAAPPTTTRPSGLRWRAAARRYLGVPYRIGGTTQDGIDCSGLVQRLYREVLGVTIPRHSRDQFSTVALRSGPRREGQLAFVGGGDESPFHVGVLLRDGRNDWSVLHASSSRGLVVEDAYEDYLRRGGDLRA
ncbi:MAG: C40 family peptidase [Thermoanaerobaculia bacterium]